MNLQRKNITEEIERMKSLFTEERLWGNLVEQEEKTNPHEKGTYEWSEWEQVYNSGTPDNSTNAVEKIVDQNTDGEGKIDKSQFMKDLQSSWQGMKNFGKDLKSHIADRKEKRQGFAQMTTKEKADAMKDQKTQQRQDKKSVKNNLAKCNKGMKTLQKYFLSNPNPKNRMTIETFKNNITGDDFKSRQSSVTGCITTFKGQLKTDKEIIANRTVTEWIKDIIIDEKNTHIDISKETIKGTGQGINIKSGAGKTIGKIMELGDDKYKVVGDKKQYFLNSQLNQVRNQQLPNILTALKKPDGKITVVDNTGKREKYRDSFEFTIS